MIPLLRTQRSFCVGVGVGVLMMTMPSGSSKQEQKRRKQPRRMRLTQAPKLVHLPPTRLAQSQPNILTSTNTDQIGQKLSLGPAQAPVGRRTKLNKGFSSTRFMNLVGSSICPSTSQSHALHPPSQTAAGLQSSSEAFMWQSSHETCLLLDWVDVVTIVYLIGLH